MSQSGFREMAENSVEQYCSISGAIKFVSAPLYVDKVIAAFELVRPEQHSLLKKLMKTKLRDYARNEQLLKEISSIRKEVKQILENYRVREL
jgi:hypothetical protein